MDIIRIIGQCVGRYSRFIFDLLLVDVPVPRECVWRDL